MPGKGLRLRWQQHVAFSSQHGDRIRWNFLRGPCCKRQHGHRRGHKDGGRGARPAKRRGDSGPQPASERRPSPALPLFPSAAHHAAQAPHHCLRTRHVRMLSSAAVFFSGERRRGRGKQQIKGGGHPEREKVRSVRGEIFGTREGNALAAAHGGTAGARVHDEGHPGRADGAADQCPGGGTPLLPSTFFCTCCRASARGAR